MAYSVDDITLVTDAVHTAGRTNPDTSNPVDVTTCMTNGTLADSCDEWKDADSGKIHIDVSGGTIDTLSIRLWLNDIMTGGDFYLMPYTSDTAVSGTNEMQDTGVDDTWHEFVLGSSFIAELNVAGDDTVAIRVASDGTSKLKWGEVQADLVTITATLAGVTRDEAGDVLISCEVTLIKVNSPTDREIVDRQVSDGTTGAYSFTVIPSQDYMILADKDLTPNKFDVTDIVQGV